MGAKVGLLFLRNSESFVRFGAVQQQRCFYCYEFGLWSEKRNWERIGVGTEMANSFQLCVSPIFLSFLLFPWLVRAA